MFCLNAFWVALRTLLGPSWASLGEALALSWPPLGSLGAPLGRLEPSKLRPKTVPKPAGVKKDREKTTLDATCPDLATLGLIFGPPGPILRALGQYFGLSMAFPGRFPPTFLAKLLHQVSRNMCGNFSVGLRHRLAGNRWELGTPTHGCNRLGPPWVRRSPRSGLQ